MTTMFHGEINHLFVKSGRNDNGDEIRLVRPRASADDGADVLPRLLYGRPIIDTLSFPHNYWRAAGHEG